MKMFLQNNRKIKEYINNKRFPVRVTHFTDLEIKKLHLSTFEYILTSYYNLCASSIKKYTINEKVFEKHRKIKEDINNKRFLVRVTLFTDHSLRLIFD